MPDGNERDFEEISVPDGGHNRASRLP